MKKLISIICVLMMVMGLMAACGSDRSAIVQEDVGDLQQEIKETVIDQAEAAEDAAEETAEQSGDESGSEVKEIGEDTALKIALKDAGLSKSDADRLKCELDYDDGRAEYEIEFRKGKKEYEYTIDAFSGKILERNIDDYDDDDDDD